MQVGTANSEPNPNQSYFNARGMWLTYILIIVFVHCIMLSIPVISVGVAWTMTVVCHNVITYFVLHVEKGSPFGTLDQGKSRILTQWEQFDDGEQYSPTKKFLAIVPIVLFLLATFYSKYDSAHFAINSASLLILAILPKLPAFYRVRLFGINKW